MEWTQERLDSLLVEWQKVLRLQDWDVKVRMVRQRDMVGSNREAEVSFGLATKSAVIRVLDPVDFERGEWEQDIEDSVVHELIHLLMAPFDPEEGTLQQTMQEQAIKSLSEALVSLKRKE